MPGAKFGVDQPCGPCDEQTQQLGPSSEESNKDNDLESPHLANKIFFQPICTRKSAIRELLVPDAP